MYFVWFLGTWARQNIHSNWKMNKTNTKTGGKQYFIHNNINLTIQNAYSQIWFYWKILKIPIHSTHDIQLENQYSRICVVHVPIYVIFFHFNVVCLRFFVLVSLVYLFTIFCFFLVLAKAFHFYVNVTGAGTTCMHINFVSSRSFFTILLR